MFIIRHTAISNTPGNTHTSRHTNVYNQTHCHQHLAHLKIKHNDMTTFITHFHDQANYVSKTSVNNNTQLSGYVPHISMIILSAESNTPENNPHRRQDVYDTLHEEIHCCQKDGWKQHTQVSELQSHIATIRHINISHTPGDATLVISHTSMIQFQEGQKSTGWVLHCFLKTVVFFCPLGKQCTDLTLL